MKLVITNEAEEDFRQAIDWYDSQSLEKGERFEKYLDSYLDLLLLQPIAFPIVAKITRKMVVPKYPFCIYYLIINDVLLVIAIWHNSRNPLHLQKRFK